MIIYGVKATDIAPPVLIANCPNCGAQNSTYLHVFQRYAHIFWIPLFPIGKTAVSQCSHCKQVLKLKEMPPALVNTYEQAKAEAKTPVWTFSGLAVVAVIIIIGVISDKNKDQRNAKLILAPKAGDIFEIKTKDRQYTLYRVDQVEADSVIIRINKFETDKVSGLADLKSKGESGYDEEQYAIAKSQLQTMFNKGEVLDIDRK